MTHTTHSATAPTDAVTLEIFKHLFASIAEEMGGRLMRSAYSPNIKERRDFSCALFDQNAEMIAQAAHIPVHLGSTPMSVEAAIAAIGLENLRPGDQIILNDPYAGGTHLPDITLVAPCFVAGEKTPRFFVANRAHHADVGGITPGSLPLSRHIDEEGLRIAPTRLNDTVFAQICAGSRTPEERRGDLYAQIAAAELGVKRLRELCERYGAVEVTRCAASLQDYAERVVRSILRDLPDGEYVFADKLDDDGLGSEGLEIHCQMSISGDSATLDFTHSVDQVAGPLNAVRAITVSAVSYAFRCLAPEDLPSNGGATRPLCVVTRNGSIVDAHFPAAVAAGNVETSQRITDVVFGALAQALPGRIPAASCGSMNNVTIGGIDPRTQQPFAYYETLAGGSGASPEGRGEDAVHTHMTNTLNTPVEALEHAYPFRVEAYRIREGSGGHGKYRGGAGLVRVYGFDHAAQVTLITERRRYAPYGLAGGGEGARGANARESLQRREPLPGKISLEVGPGDRIVVETPGGGGFGSTQETDAQTKTNA